MPLKPERVYVWPNGDCITCGHREYRHWASNAPCCAQCPVILPNPPLVVWVNEEVD